MKKRSVGWILMGLLVAGVTTLVAPGCGSSIAGEYRRNCIATCETGDDCEDYTVIQVDREDCIRDCDDQAEDFERDLLDQCDDEVEVDGSQADRCNEAINALGAYCRDDDESEILEALGDVADECPTNEIYRCR